MNKYFRFQIGSILKNPTIYLMIFVIAPLLFFLSSAFLPSITILPGIVVFIIFSITFFVVGTNIFQVKSTSFFKRFSTLGISKAKYIFINGLISILISIFAVYIFIEALATISFLMNYSYVTLSYDNYTYNEISELRYGFNFMSPTKFSWFFSNDMLSTLNDATFLLVLNFLNNASDDDLKNLTALLEYLLELDEIGTINISTINEILIEQLIEIIKGPRDILNNKVLEMYQTYIEVGHAPEGITIITDIIIEGGQAQSHNGHNGIGIEEDGEVYVYFKALYEIEIYYSDENGSKFKYRITVFFSKLMPTLGILFSPILNYDSQVADALGTDGFDLELFWYWIGFMCAVGLLSISSYAIMLLINAASKNFEQYYFMGGLFVLSVIAFSGLFLPFSFFMATPALYTMTLLMPSTTPLMLMNTLLLDGFTSVPLQLDFFTLNLFVYPFMLCLISVAIGYKLLSKDGDKLVSKFSHDDRSKKTAIANLAFSFVFLALSILILWVLLQMRIDNVDSGGIGYYPTDLVIELSIALIVLYAFMCYANTIYLQNKSQTLSENKILLAIVNCIVMFPIGIFTLAFTSKSKIIKKQ